MSTQGASPCPLCASLRPTTPRTAHGRQFFDCPECRLVYAAHDELPDAAKERARYDTHHNEVDDPGYRGFLSPALDAVRARCPVGAQGLDYGAGPGPALAAMLGEAGYPTEVYDPFYHPDPGPISGERRHDFIVCTETAEHFHAPAAEFERLFGLLAGPGAPLVIMTQPLTPELDFGGWWYARDPTHVAFYRDETFAWIAARHGARVERPAPALAVFTGTAAGLELGAGSSDFAGQSRG